MSRWFAFLLAVLVYAAVHEGMHAAVSAAFDEYRAFHVRPFGLEVEFKTPVEQRSGGRWALISGAANGATVALGAILSALGRPLSRLPRALRAWAFYLTLLMLLLDPLNLAVGPLLYGGDAIGIAVGLKMPLALVQCASLLIFFINREAAAQYLTMIYQVNTKHSLFRPLFKKRRTK